MRLVPVAFVVASSSLVGLAACGGVVRDDCPTVTTAGADKALTVVVAHDLASSRVFFLGECRGIQCSKPVAMGCVEWKGELDNTKAACQIALQTVAGKTATIDVTRADLCTTGGNKPISFGSETLR